MNTQVNRLLMAFEQLLREANREAINPILDELSVEALQPVAKLVARARADYLQSLYQLAQHYEQEQGLPSEQELDQLAQKRRCFMDLVEGSKSFETAISRGYLDVKGT